METTVFLYANVVDILLFKEKGSHEKPYILCLDNMSKEFAVNSMKKKLA